MKYIRTKNDKVLIAPEIYDNGAVVLMSDPPQYETRNAKGEWGCVLCSDVIKYADTIEELCDEFVIIDNNGKPQVYSPFDLKYWKTDNSLFGAIWTDKGLTYVAKMNDKGEFELL